MSDTDVQDTWQRLRDLYAGMSEAELEAVADQGYELTDVAKQVLNAEISRRGLNVIMRLAPPLKEPEPLELGDADFDPATLDLVPAVVVENSDEAAWVKQMLNDAGVPCYFGPQLAEDVRRLQFPDEFGVQVRVLRTDRDRVPYVLREFGQRFAQDGGSEEELEEAPVRCPRCRSTEVVFKGLDSELPEGDVRRAKFNWHCDACGREWQDDGIGSPT